ncbi:MAG: ligase-associated DNA damage response DEXH box helicase, partial [Saprospiraceae bacterium]
ITPIRALSREIQQAAQTAADELGLDFRVAIRTGDTSTSERRKQLDKGPELLITTPESLHMILANKAYPDFFSRLECVVADEWHELIGTKRGVLVELALSRLRGLRSGMRTWGISATIGNLSEAAEVLLGVNGAGDYTLIRADIVKRIRTDTLLPDEIETFPWAGHLGIKMLEKVLPIVREGRSTLIFTNTRAQCEIWYQRLLAADDDLAGLIAMHHGSISRELRDWVEAALHDGTLKAVVCTSSLDLGVDFRPVENIVQVGSPKGVARFLQRAGRSGHQPGAESVIHFVPTNTLELIEASALRRAAAANDVESRLPYIRCFDLLVQYLVTLAVSVGFRPVEILGELRATYCFQSLSDEEWGWALDFITIGGRSLGAYDEFHKVTVNEDGLYVVKSKQIATMHRFGIGAIVNSPQLMIKYQSGGYVGNIEESFISKLQPGETFWFAGKSLEFIRLKGMEAQVRRSRSKKGKIPTWAGGRMSFSNQMSHYLRDAIDRLSREEYGMEDRELAALEPLRAIQIKRSALPLAGQFLIEYFQDRDGYHLLMYPLEGRAVHEGLSALIAHRISQLQRITFTIAINDYGFELLSDQPIPVEMALGSDIFNTTYLTQDIDASVNASQMARRHFRDIASIAGLIFKGYPGRNKKAKHLQSSSQLFFDVFSDYDPDNLLLRQAYEEVMVFQLEEARLRAALNRINRQEILFMEPGKATPLSFPLIVSRLRERLSSEKLEDRIRRMKVALVKD